MDLKKLRYFLAVAEEGQITKAARRLHMAQPPLTHQLKVFEKELGVQLLEKAGRRVRLTKAGCALRDRAEQILEIVQVTENELKEFGDGLQGSVSVGSGAGWGSSLLPEWIRKFNEAYPAVTFNLFDGTSSRMRELLDNGVIDMAIIPYAIDDSRYEVFRLPAEPMVAAMHPRWAATLSPGGISVAQIADKPLILPRMSRITDFFTKHFADVKIFCLHVDIRSMLAMAACGLGVTVVPESAVRFSRDPGLVYRVIDKPPVTTTANVFWLKNRSLATVARNFIAAFPEELLRG
ncbi:MAG TPA: LysR family transcriptional regulator [Negativicutes bacterium]|nr:LysR family transcriptional regulator [Negativicutes bacterium]